MPVEVRLAFGRLFRILSRPFDDGDIEDYYRCRSIIMDAAEAAGINAELPSIGDHRPGWNFGNLTLD